MLILFAGLLAVGIYGSFQVEDGLELTEVVPQGSVAHQFVEAQFKYFSFYPMSLITQKGFDYANRQKTLYSYHEAFKEVSFFFTSLTFILWCSRISKDGLPRLRGTDE